MATLKVVNMGKRLEFVAMGVEVRKDGQDDKWVEEWSDTGDGKGKGGESNAKNVRAGGSVAR